LNQLVGSSQASELRAWIVEGTKPLELIDCTLIWIRNLLGLNTHFGLSLITLLIAQLKRAIDFEVLEAALYRPLAGDHLPLSLICLFSVLVESDVLLENLGIFEHHSIKLVDSYV